MLDYRTQEKQHWFWGWLNIFVNLVILLSPVVWLGLVIWFGFNGHNLAVGAFAVVFCYSLYPCFNLISWTKREINRLKWENRGSNTP